MNDLSQIAQSRPIRYAQSVEMYNGDKVDLYYKLYKPDKSDQLRPTVIMAPGGSFFYTVAENVGMRNAWLRKGYNVVHIESYRIGYYRSRGFLCLPDNLAFFIPNPYDNDEFARSAWRTSQDLSICLAHIFETGTELGIDTSNVIVGGISAGGIAWMNAIFANTRNDIPENVGVVDPVVGCQNGKRPELGGIPYSHRVKGVYLALSGMIDNVQLDILDDQKEIPIYLYHRDEDPVVSSSIDQAWHDPLFFGNNQFGLIKGSSVIAEHLAYSGHLFKERQVPGTTHSIHNGFELVEEMDAFFRTYSICEEPGDIERYGNNNGPEELNTEENLLSSFWKISPNPSNGLFNIEFRETNSNAYNISLFDATGKFILGQEQLNGSFLLDISQYQKGTYFCRISNTENQFLGLEKIIFQ